MKQQDISPMKKEAPQTYDVSSSKLEKFEKELAVKSFIKTFLIAVVVISVLALIYWYSESTYDPNAPRDYQAEEDAALDDALFNSYRGY